MSKDQTETHAQRVQADMVRSEVDTNGILSPDEARVYKQVYNNIYENRKNITEEQEKYYDSLDRNGKSAVNKQYLNTAYQALNSDDDRKIFANIKQKDRLDKLNRRARSMLNLTDEDMKLKQQEEAKLKEQEEALKQQKKPSTYNVTRRQGTKINEESKGKQPKLKTQPKKDNFFTTLLKAGKVVLKKITALFEDKEDSNKQTYYNTSAKDIENAKKEQQQKLKQAVQNSFKQTPEPKTLAKIEEPKTPPPPRQQQPRVNTLSDDYSELASKLPNIPTLTEERRIYEKTRMLPDAGTEPIDESKFKPPPQNPNDVREQEARDAKYNEWKKQRENIKAVNEKLTQIPNAQDLAKQNQNFKDLRERYGNIPRTPQQNNNRSGPRGGPGGNRPDF